MLGRGLHPAAAKFGKTEAITLEQPGPSHGVPHWGGSSGPKNADPAKFPCCIVKRSIIRFLVMLLSGLRLERRITRFPEVGNDSRQPEIVVVLTSTHDLRVRRRWRLGNFVAEVLHDVLNGVIDVQLRHRSSSAVSF
jgi:hypothetical protein